MFKFAPPRRIISNDTELQKLNPKPVPVPTPPPPPTPPPAPPNAPVIIEPILPKNSSNLTKLRSLFTLTNPQAAVLETDVERMLQDVDKDVISQLPKSKTAKYWILKSLHYTLLSLKYTIMFIFLIVSLAGLMLHFRDDLPKITTFTTCLLMNKNCDNTTTNDISQLSSQLPQMIDISSPYSNDPEQFYMKHLSTTSEESISSVEYAKYLKKLLQ